MNPVAQLRIGKNLTDRPIQLLYPLELYCEGITTNEDEKKNELNPSPTEFRLKQNRKVAVKGHCH